MKKLDIEAIEKAINEIMPGLTMYVRDINLNEQYAKKYVPGRIIRELGFTDASCRVGGSIFKLHIRQRASIWDI